MAIRAAGRTSNSTPSIANSLLYCLIKAFFGSVRIFTKADSSSSAKAVTTGKRRPAQESGQI